MERKLRNLVVLYLFSYFYIKIKITNNKYENNIIIDIVRKGEYGANTAEKQIIIKTKRPPEKCRKTQYLKM
jgi:hypothetical protein